MDRAMQCDSLLSSIRDHVTGVDRVVVIARATSELHERSYELLADTRAGVSVLRESADRTLPWLLSNVINGVDYVCINVDDQIFYRPSDFGAAVAALAIEAAFVWSWRLGYMQGQTTRQGDYWAAMDAQDEIYRYLWHSDGALYRQRDYVSMLDERIPEWRTRTLIPNDLEGLVVRGGIPTGLHLGPPRATCMTWQINKESSTAGVWGGAWRTVPGTELDELARAYLAGKRVDNAALYADTSWTTRFNPPGAYPTHVSACEEASLFYASLIK
jgi:hypothetical protein